jgi:alkylhydroperoxidase/carboxymuconolactone decarboxylase family protein
MGRHYYDAEGIKKLRKLRQLKPELFASFVEFNGKVFAEGALSTRVKELIAVAAAHVTQCPYCIDEHTKRAKKAGASEAEVAEAVFVAMAMRAGGAWAHGALAMDALEEG